MQALDFFAQPDAAYVLGNKLDLFAQTAGR
jgi:hypothetical protein